MSSFTTAFPPFVFMLGPWLLLGLVLSGPFLALLTVAVAATALPAVLALPYLLLRRFRARRVPVAAPRVSIDLGRAAA